MTLLGLAVSSQDKALVQVILSAGADVWWVRFFFSFSLFLQWCQVFMQVSEHLLACIDFGLHSLPSHGSNGRLEPPLYTACRLVFFTRCTSIYFPLSIDFTIGEAWHCDMHRLKDDELAELLIRSGANLNSTDFYGHTPLWYIYIRHWWHSPNYQLACCVPDDLRHFML